MQIWQDILSTAIVGTERQKAVFANNAPNDLQGVLSQIEPDDAESALLKSAAVCSIWRKAGKDFSIDNRNLPETAPPEELQYISENAERIFNEILQISNGDYLTEFCELTAKHQRIILPRYLPKLFQQTQKDADLRLKLLPLVGMRGRWLARQNADWRWVSVDENADEIWETGTTKDRLFALRWRREKNAAAAREMLVSTWKSESAKERDAFIEVLRTNLSENDEPFLSDVLQNDKSADVRRVAFDLLLLLPKSELAQQLAERATQFLIFEKGGFLSKSKMKIVFPEKFEVAKTDVINNVQLFFRENNVGEKSMFLIKLLRCVPPKFWENRFSTNSKTIIEATEKNDWKSALQNGFKLAAVRCGDGDWLKTILPQTDAKDYYLLSNQIDGSLTNAQIENLIATLVTDKSNAENNFQFAAQLFYKLKRTWSVEFATLIFDFLKTNAARNSKQNSKTFDILSNQTLGSALNIPFEFLKTFDTNSFVKSLFESSELPYIKSSLERFSSQLEIRKRIHQAFEE